MEQALAHLGHHGYVLFLVGVLLARLGVPLPEMPLLLGAGALARSGQLDPFSLLGLAIAASTAGHSAWFLAGRRIGAPILHMVCRVSLEPDACVRRGRKLFAARGAGTLVLANFVPGVDTVAQVLAALTGMTWRRFLALTFAGAAFWSATLLGAGYLLGPALARVLGRLEGIGTPVATLLVVAVLLRVVWKFVARRRALRRLATARISAEELKRKLDAHEPLLVLDLRHPLELESEPLSIPGAIRIFADDLEARFSELPRDVEMVTLCSCPNEASAAEAALRLQRLGVEHVRPLTGGLRDWVRLGLPLAPPRAIAVEPAAE